MRNLDQLAFDNRFATLPEQFHTRLAPTPVPDPYLVACNPDALGLLGLEPKIALAGEFVEIFSGNAAPTGSEPLAAV